MKVCVITPFDSANYGAFLQAYASKKFLEKQGNEVSFLKWRNEEERKNEFFVKPNGIKARFRYYQKYRFLKQRYSIFTEALDVFNIEELCNLNHYDTVIIGSDEVWNINVSKFQKAYFYAQDIPSTVKKMAYAPSVAEASLTDFLGYPSQSDGLKSISLIGARDEETKYIYKAITGKDVNIVCDPTLLLTEGEWDLPDYENKFGKYILVYSYDIPKGHRTLLKEVAKRQGCKLIALGLYQSWCDINISCGPMEFNSFIKNAEAVYTTTFHGSIFTLLNHKKCLIRATSKKLNDLLERFDVMSMKEPEQINADEMERLLFMERDYSQFETKLCSIREESRKLYIDSLEHTS